MADIDAVKRILEEQYGIRSAKELEAAVGKMKKLDIGFAASQVRKTERSK